MEFKTYAIWGVQQSHLASRVQESLERLSGPMYNKCHWRGEGVSRHIAAEFHITPNTDQSAQEALGWRELSLPEVDATERPQSVKDTRPKLQGLSRPLEPGYKPIDGLSTMWPSKR
jgi:hypothetical protein